MNITLAPYVDARTHESLGLLPLSSQTGTVAEKYCAWCRAWVTVGVGQEGGLMGFMVAPCCDREWTETPPEEASD